VHVEVGHLGTGIAPDIESETVAALRYAFALSDGMRHGEHLDQRFAVLGGHL
jgi:hypothetical protein